MSIYLKEITDYALVNAKNHVDNQTGEINLTELEEDTQDHFNLSDKLWEEEDISFKIFKKLEKYSMLSDNNSRKRENNEKWL